MLRQEGHHGIAVGVLEDQCGHILGILRHIDDGVAVIAVNEGGVAAILQVDAGIVGGGLAVLVDGQGAGLGGDEGLHGVIEALNTLVLGVVIHGTNILGVQDLHFKPVQRGRRQTDGLGEGVISVVCAALVPVVVTLQVQIFIGMGLENFLQIDEIDAVGHHGFDLVQNGALVGYLLGNIGIGDGDGGQRRRHQGYAGIGEQQRKTLEDLAQLGGIGLVEIGLGVGSALVDEQAVGQEVCRVAGGSLLLHRLNGDDTQEGEFFACGIFYRGGNAGGTGLYALDGCGAVAVVFDGGDLGILCGPGQIAEALTNRSGQRFGSAYHDGQVCIRQQNGDHRLGGAAGFCRTGLRGRLSGRHGGLGHRGQGRQRGKGFVLFRFCCIGGVGVDDDGEILVKEALQIVQLLGEVDQHLPAEEGIGEESGNIGKIFAAGHIRDLKFRPFGQVAVLTFGEGGAVGLANIEYGQHQHNGGDQNQHQLVNGFMFHFRSPP